MSTSTRTAPNGQTITYDTTSFPQTRTVLNLSKGGVPEDAVVDSASATYVTSGDNVGDLISGN